MLDGFVALLQYLVVAMFEVAVLDGEFLKVSERQVAIIENSGPPNRPNALVAP